MPRVFIQGTDFGREEKNPKFFKVKIQRGKKEFESGYLFDTKASAARYAKETYGKKDKHWKLDVD